MYDVCVPDLIKRLNYDIYTYGDVVRLTQAVRGSKGKRYKFVGAVFESEEDTVPAYLSLIEIGRGHSRSIRPEFVVKDVAASKAAHARSAAGKA